MKLNRQAIQRMVDSGQLNIGGRKSGGGSGAGGGGGVSATWVDDNYISKAFFARLFTIHSDTVTQQDPHGEVVEPNDAETTIDNIEASVDFWSVGNVSALGPAGSGGGGGGLTLYEPLASINSANLGTPTSNGQVIMWNAALSKWVYGIPSGGSSLTMQTVWQNLAASTTEQIALTHLTTALTGYVKTADLSTLTIGKADKLSTARNLWGQSFDGSAEVKGTLEHVTNIQLQELSANTGAQIKFFYGGANSITSYIHENQSGSLSINGQIFVTNNGNVGIGGSASGIKLNITGDAKASNLESAGYVKATGYLSAGSYITATTYISANTYLSAGTTVTAGTSVTAGTTLNAGTNVIAGAADGTFIQIGNIRIGYDQTNDALEVYKLSGSSHASANLYARGNVSALGPAGSGGGGGVSLNQPLSGINSSGLSAPTTNGQILMYDSSTGKWKYGTVGLTMDTVWNQLSNPTNQQINISHLTNALSGYSTSDTRNTTGIYQSSGQRFLVGSSSVGTTADSYGVTYTNATCYMQSGSLYSNNSQVVNLADTQTISGKKTYTSGLKVSGRFANSGDDEGIVIGLADNDFAGLILGSTNSRRSVFYLDSDYAFWRYNDGTNGSKDIKHPNKSGTIALVSDIPSSSDFVKTTGDQSISGSKTFNNNLTKMVGTYGGLCIYAGIANGEGFRLETCDSSGTGKSGAITVWQTGKVGIGTTSVSDYKLNINGTTCLGGSTFYNSGDATLKIYNANGTYSNETVALQSCIDGRDGETAESGTTYDPAGSVGYRMVIALQPRGGRVAIGKLIPSYTLDVNGTINATAIKVNGVDVLTTSVSSLTVTGTLKTNHIQVGQDGGTGTYSISTSNNDASIQINGNSIGIGGTNTNYKFYVNGASCLSSDVLINATALPTGVTAKLYVKGDTCFDSGNVGIGTAPNSGYRLKVSGKTYMTALEVQGTSTASQNFTLTWNTDGYYELGTISGTNTEIRTAGQWYGVWRGASDIRKKNIIKNLSVCVEKIADAPIFDFTWKVGDDKGVYLGTSAQYIQQIFPSAVSKMKDGYLGLDYSATALAAAVMTARTVVDHERRIRELEAEIERLKGEMAS